MKTITVATACVAVAVALVFFWIISEDLIAFSGGNHDACGVIISPPATTGHAHASKQYEEGCT